MNIVHSNAFLRPVTFMGHERVCPCPCVGRLCGFRVFVVSMFTFCYVFHIPFLHNRHR